MPTAAPPRILVTRSEPGASETAARLRAAGFVAVAESLFTIAPIEAEVPDFDALAFTSANGARRFSRMSPRRDVPVFCVGGRTTQAAREMGFKDVTSADGDTVALTALILRELPVGARLLHAGNEAVRGDVSGQLAAAGRDASFLAIFRAIPVSAPGANLAAHLSGEPAFDAIMIHSPRAADILGRFATGSRANLAIAAISAAAAAPLAGIASAVEIAAAPDEPALFSALARLVFG